MAELWQMASAWLQSLDVLTPDSPALIPQARVYDLALALQDGTVLCHALNRLKADSVTMIHEKPTKQFMKMQNINSFLAAATEKFGLKPTDLFMADQLYYASDFARVIQTLSLLSKTQLAGLAGFKYFPPDNSSAVSDRADNGEGEDMYQTLEDLVGQSISLEEAAADAAAYDPDNEEEGQDEIYGSLQNVIEDGTDEVYTDLLYSEGESIYGMGVTTPDEKRNCVLNELHDTERNYVKVLETIIEHFQKPICASKTFTKLDQRVIFSNINDLLVAHKAFLADIDKSMQSQTGRIVSQPILDAMVPFRCYGTFCCEIPEAIAKLKELQNKPVTAKIIDGAKAASGQRFALKDLLNVPMQRILKYPLLLKELIKNTPDSHPDKVKLHQALSAVQDLAKYINDTKKEYDNLKNMIASLKMYTGKPLQEYGSLVKDGDLTYKAESSREKMKPRYVFLFSSAMVFCKPKGVFFHFKSTTEFEPDQELIDVPHWSLPKDEQGSKPAFAWSLKSKKGETHTFAAKSLPAKKKWMAAMQLNLDFVKDKVSGPPSVAPRGAGPSTLSPSDAGSEPTTPVTPTRPTSMMSPPKAAPGTDKKTEKAPASEKKKTSVSAPPPDKAKKQSYEQWVPTAPGSAPAQAAAEAAVPIDSLSGSSEAGWYAGKMPRAKAEKLLTSAPDGTFLVRESEARPGDYSLSVKKGQVKHIKINCTGGKYDIAPDAKAFPTVQELVAHFQVHSLNRHFPGMETTLAIPFKDAVARYGGTMKNGQAMPSSGPMGIGRCRSRFAYSAKSHDELTFERGVEIVILSTHDQDPGWWKGRLPSGKEGIFPANYVQQL